MAKKRPLLLDSPSGVPQSNPWHEGIAAIGFNARTCNGRGLRSPGAQCIIADAVLRHPHHKWQRTA